MSYVRYAPSGRGGRPALGRALAVAGLLAGLSGCDGLLDVQNPNNLTQEDLDNPAAATALVNGALASLSRAVGQVVAPYSVATDEMIWTGSREAWNQLNQGQLADFTNEYIDGAYPFLAEARWLADEGIRKLEAFDADGTLRSRRDLPRAYLYAGIAYSTIGDTFDDFTLSDRMEASPPVGEDQMVTLYDRAIEYLDTGLALAREVNDGELQTRILATRARVKHGRAVWQKLNPKGQVPADPLVAPAGAVADAEAVLQRVGAGADWSFRLEYSSSTVSSFLASETNQRSELSIGPAYVDYHDPVTRRQPRNVVLMDPIDGVPDPALSDAIQLFRTSVEYAPQTVVSAREMHLILAEAALAQGDVGRFATHINALRAVADPTLTPYDPATHSVSPLALLKHSRRVNLFLQGRRLADHYRFGEPDADWQPNSTAATGPGTFFPITITERRSNPHLTR